MLPPTGLPLPPMRLARLAAAALCLSLPVAAQPLPTADEPGGGETAAQEGVRFGRFLIDPALQVGVLVQAQATLPLAERLDGPLFQTPTARLSARGLLDGGVGYLLQIDAARTPTLLDLMASYQASPSGRVAAGRFKVPFSSEALTPTSRNDFVDRSQAVRAITPGREVGVAVDAGIGGTPLLVRGGLFNAPTADGGAGRLLVAGRVTGRTPAATGRNARGLRLTAGLNGALTTGPGAGPSVGRVGADVRLRTGPLLVAAEALALAADSTADGSGRPVRQHGGYLTVGVDAHPRHRLLARVDLLSTRATATATRGTTTDLVVGYNAFLTPAASVQLNVAAPLGDGRGGARVLALVQIAL